MECAICLETINDKQTGLLHNSYTSPCCEQNIHKKCLIKWLKDNNTCPLCRENLKLISNGNYIECSEKRFRILLSIYATILLILAFCLDNNIFIFIFVISLMLIILFFIINFVIQCYTSTQTIIHHIPPIISK